MSLFSYKYLVIADLLNQSISDIGKLVFEIETLFSPDPKTTKVSFSF